NFSVCGEVSDQVGIFGGDGGGGDSGGEAESGVREAIVGAAHGADKRGHGAEIGSGSGSRCTVANSFAVSSKGYAGSGFLLVEDFVEKEDFAGDFVVTKRLQFFEGVDSND